MSDLTEKQHAFAVDLAGLILRFRSFGYDVALGEAWRPGWVAYVYEAFDRGIKESVHCDRLAIDLVVRSGDRLVEEVSELRPFGDFWKGFRVGNAWGGDFKRVDPLHFSREHGGRK